MLCALPLIASFFLTPTAGDVTDETAETTTPTPVMVMETVVETPQATPEAFVPFTGEVTRSRVRLRAEPHLGAHITRELEQGELLVVTDETNDFYAVRPNAGQYSYVFRTYVLDGVIEGTRVNVRLAPDLDSPVLTQLNTGDKVEQTGREAEGKWLEIAAPDSVRFYVAKDYVSNIGPETLAAERLQRNSAADALLLEAITLGQAEITKQFEQIEIDEALARFEKIRKDFGDYSSHVERANEAESLVQEAYLEKKIAFLEAKANQVGESWEAHNAELKLVVDGYRARLTELEAQAGAKPSNNTAPAATVTTSTTTTVMAQAPKSSVWTPVEESVYLTWKQDGTGTIEEFYREETLAAETLSGRIRPYTTPVKNRPGDYMLVGARNDRPIAFLYSTKIDLADKVGKTVTVRGAPRPNNHFAFPAYHVLSVE